MISNAEIKKFSVNDIWQVFDEAENLEVNQQGDFVTVVREELTQQRIIRRLLTNPGDMLAHPEYGAGLPRYIGQILTEDKYNEIRGVITEQIFLENTVLQNPAPEITFYLPNLNVLEVTIVYYSRNDNKAYSFSFSVNS